MNHWLVRFNIFQPFPLSNIHINESHSRVILVGGLVAIFYFPMTIGNVIIPIDELIFFRGVFPQPPTSIHISQFPRNGMIPALLGALRKPWSRQATGRSRRLGDEFSLRAPLEVGVLPMALWWSREKKDRKMIYHFFDGILLFYLFFWGVL